MNRISMMDELAASLAHEINQPMVAAAANATACVRWLRHETPQLAKASESALKVASEVRLASDIIERVRSLYRRGTAKREPVDVNRIVQEMIVLLRDAANRNSISIRTELDSELPMIEADRVQLQQVLMNLMRNAIDAMEDTNGELTITSRKTEDGEILIAVSDSGHGLPVDGGERLFAAFFTTKPQGTGMGLSISRRIIESHVAACGRAPTQSVEQHFSSRCPEKRTRLHLPLHDPPTNGGRVTHLSTFSPSSVKFPITP